MLPKSLLSNSQAGRAAPGGSGASMHTANNGDLLSTGELEATETVKDGFGEEWAPEDVVTSITPSGCEEQGE